MSEQTAVLGRHRRKPHPHRTRRIVTTAGVTLAIAAAGAVALVAPDPAPVSAVQTMPVGQAERVFLTELRDAGIVLTPPQQAEALTIAREHIEHGHLDGMRQQIRDDFRTRVGGLTEDQVESAKVVVEHHFRNVTGRKQ